MEVVKPPSKTLTPSLIRGLASCDTKTRSKTLKTFLNWLPSQTVISDDDFKKLWKALFYCMWHCDKLPNQTHLISRLSTLLPSLPLPLSLSYFSNFVLTMRKEWSGIDHLRLDKFYLLVRHFVRNLFVLMKNIKWDLIVLEEFIRVFEKDLFFFLDVDDDNGGKVDSSLGNGVCYHVVSVFCDEIKTFLPLSKEVLDLLFRPFVGVMGKCDNKVLIGKVKKCVFEVLLKNGYGLLEVKKVGQCEGEVEGNDERVLFGTIALALGFATRFYELGSSEDCVQGNRKVVLGLYEEFSKLEKEKAVLGIEVSLPEGNVVDDEVPQLMPINGDGRISNGDEIKKGSKEKKSKKKKKKNVGNDDTNCDIEMVNVSENLNEEVEEGGNVVELSKDLISNLQKQFEKIAAESGLEGDGVSAIDSPTMKVQVNGKRAKKRKRSKSVAIADASEEGDVEKEAAVSNTEEKSTKRVRFAMKNNIVWKPHSPLPPQNVRIPPSSTPRGSALKKGVSPGPIRDTALEVKKAKKKKKPSPLKKARKVKSVSLAGKRGKKKKGTLMSA